MSVSAKVKVLSKLDNIELSCINSISKSSRLHNHYHEGVSFAVITNGVGEFRIRNISFKVKKGATITIAPGETHTSGKSIGNTSLEYRVFYVSQKTISDILAPENHHMTGEIFFKDRISYDLDFYSDCLTSHINLFESTDLIAEESIFNELIINLMIKFTTSNLKFHNDNFRPDYLPIVMDYIQANFKRQVSLKELSTIAKRSPSQILKSFQKHVGISPHAYIINLRIIEAKQLFKKDFSIAQTAIELGFTDQSHFHRYFKRYNHITPKKFKEAIL